MTAIELVDISEWIRWPEEDVREYASEIAEAWQLSDDQRKYLTGEMLDRSGHSRFPPEIPPAVIRCNR